MPIDPRIALGVQPMQLPQQDPNQGMNALARVMQIKSAMQEGDMNALKMQDLQRTTERRNKLDSLLGGFSGKPEELEVSLLKGGFIDEAMKIGKDRREGMKLENESANAAAQRAKAELETALKKTEHVSSVLSLAKDPQSYSVIRTVIKNQFGQDLPEQFDPNMVSALVAQGQTLTQRLAAEHQRLTLAETVRHNTTGEVETGRHNRSTESLTARGQNMVDARAQQTIAQGRVPAGYRQKSDGSLEFIPGGPADPNAAKKAAPTEFQGKAAMFGTRAQEADRIISELEGKYSPTGINTKQALGHTPLVGGGLEAAANLTLSDSSQKAEQAQRDFVNAVLRLESGAAIAESEFNNAKKQYFRQPGDSPAVVAQKAANRKTAIQGLISNARPGAVEQTGGATGSFAPSPDVDALLKKYGGK